MLKYSIKNSNYALGNFRHEEGEHMKNGESRRCFLHFSYYIKDKYSIIHYIIKLIGKRKIVKDKNKRKIKKIRENRRK